MILNTDIIILKLYFMMLNNDQAIRFYQHWNQAQGLGPKRSQNNSNPSLQTGEMFHEKLLYL